MMTYTYSGQVSNNVVVNGFLVGGLIVGSLAFSVLLCLLSRRLQRSRSKKKRMEGLLRIRGLVRPMVADQPVVAGAIRSFVRTPPPFSREGLTASIVVPDKCITRKPTFDGLWDKLAVSREHGPSPTSSTPSFPEPVQSARSLRPRPPALSILSPARPGHSRSSSGFSVYAAFPSPPGPNSPQPTFATPMSPSQAKPVRQLFEPSLPDELALVRYGEYLMVLRSFDDGWCLVARDTLRSPCASRFSPRTANNGDNTDVGLVPAWVFANPPIGAPPTRPFRGRSFNALSGYLGYNTVNTRNAVISWSNFG